MTTALAPAPVLSPARVVVRQARQDDVPWLLSQLRVFDQFFDTKRRLFPDEATATTVLLSLLAFHPFFVADTGFRPEPERVERIGFIAGAIGPHPYNPALRVLSELFWWVDERYRGGRAGLALLDAFQAYGERNADWVIMTLEAKSPVNERSLTKRGFHLHERSYLWEVE
jgi:hypothetical protein